MKVGGKARKNQKNSQIKRWSVPWYGIAGDLFFFGKNPACVEFLPHLAPQKKYLNAREMGDPLCGTLCGVLMLY